MSSNINEIVNQHDTSDCMVHSSDLRRNIRPKLSLLNPDDIPPICNHQSRQSSKKSNDKVSHHSESNPEVPYISPPTSDTDTVLEVSSSSSSQSSESTDSDTTSQYSSSQLHYYRNRDKILAYAKLRYQNNRESLLAYSKKYQSERKDIVKDRNVTYYEANRERLLKDRAKKITCECGKVIAKGSLSNHLNTAYHLRRIAVIEKQEREDIPPPPGLNVA